MIVDTPMFSLATEGHRIHKTASIVFRILRCFMRRRANRLPISSLDSLEMVCAPIRSKVQRVYRHVHPFSECCTNVSSFCSDKPHRNKTLGSRRHSRRYRGNISLCGVRSIRHYSRKKAKETKLICLPRSIACLSLNVCQKYL